MKTLFNSYTLPIPLIRFDIQRIPIEQNGETLLYFYDSMGYSTPDFAIPSDAESILSLIDGTRSVEDIIKFSSNEVSKEQILGYVRFLDEHSILDSKAFAEHAEIIESEYERSNVHFSTTAGNSYPSGSEELKDFLKKAFEEHEPSNPVSSAKALYAPHIDPRIGMSSYVKAFSSIKNLKPKRVVILATSHYSGLYSDMYEESPFIISDKTFSMPNGEISSSFESIQKIKDNIQPHSNVGQKQILKQVQNDPPKDKNEKKSRHVELDSASVKASTLGISLQDRAHRIEHSIEVHLLFLNHIWQHDFEIIPILVGGLDELFYSKDSFKEQQLANFAEYLRKEFAADSDTFFLISGDLSHFGHKFGDERIASKMFEEVTLNDERFLKIGTSGNPDKLIKLMKEEYDPYRICGFPPLLTFLKIFPNINGKVLSYDLWDERERESAVSFGSILYQ